MNDLIEDILKNLEDVIDKKDVVYFDYGKQRLLSKTKLKHGAIMISPVSTGIRPVTTGVTDEDSYSIEIILAKNLQDKYYVNAQKETAAKFLVRLMEGRDASKILKTDTIRYVVRTNFKNTGLLQSDISIEYDSGDVDNNGAATATMTLTQIDHTTQPVT